MSKRYFQNIKISDEEWNGVKVASASVRPNAKSAYGSGLNAEDTKAIFDKGPELIKERLNKLVDDTAAVEEDRTAAEKARVEAETKRDKAEKARVDAEDARAREEYGRTIEESARKTSEDVRRSSEEARQNAENIRQAAFEGSQKEREEEFNAAQKERAERFDAFIGGLVVNDGVAKIKSKNLLDVTWKNGIISSENNGAFVANTSGTNLAAFEEYIEVEGNATYTLSASYVPNVVIYLFEYGQNKQLVANSSKWMPKAGHWTVSLSQDTRYVRLYLRLTSGSLPWNEVIPTHFQLEKGDVATYYELPLVINDNEVEGVSQTNTIVHNLAHCQVLNESDITDGVVLKLDGKNIDSSYFNGFMTTEYLQMRKGDTINTYTWLLVFDVFEYSLNDKSLISRSSRIQEYTVKNDCFLKINFYRQHDGADKYISVADSLDSVHILRNQSAYVDFGALPMDKLRELIKSVMNET